MTISDDDFRRWMRKGSAKITVLAEAEFAYESGGVMAMGTIFLSDQPYTSAATDANPNTPYRCVINKAPELERGMSLAALGGRGSRSTSALGLDGTGGSIDFLFDAITDARDVEFFVGDQSWPRSDFRKFLTASMGPVSSANDTEMSLVLQDKNFLLNDTILGSSFTGSAGNQVFKPIVLGYVRNFDFTPYLYDSTALSYYFNDFAVDPATFGPFAFDVRDAGGSLITAGLLDSGVASIVSAAGTDTLTYGVPHGLSVDDVLYFYSGATLPGGLAVLTQYWVIAAGLTATDFRLSLIKGGTAVDITTSITTSNFHADRRRFFIDYTLASLSLSSKPQGRLTMDVQGLDATGELGAVGGDSAPHKAMKYVLKHYTVLTVAEYDSVGIDALSAAEAYVDGFSGFVPARGIVYGKAITQRENILSVFDEIALMTYSWFGWNVSGVLTVGRLDLANLGSATSVDTITTADLLGELTSENLPLQWGRLILDADKNFAVQSDGLLSTLSADVKTAYAKEFFKRVSSTDNLNVTTYLPFWWHFHKSGIDSNPVETFISEPFGGTGQPTTAQQACDAITALFRPYTRVHRATVGLDKCQLNPGDCVKLTHPRYGLSLGVNCRVVSIKPRVSDRACDLVLVRQATPDYTTASHTV